MSPPITTLLLLALSTITTASPNLCPSFTLTASAPNQEYNNQLLIQSGRSTYLSSEPPTYPDAVVTFFLNDTTHLYATNMNVSYIDEFETGPFMLVTIEEGFPIFDNNPSVHLFETWSGTGWNFTSSGNESFVGYVPQGVGFAGNDSSVGGWVVCYDEGPAGLPQVAEVTLGTVGNTGTTDDSSCVQTLFRVTDVNVTAAPFC